MNKTLKLILLVVCVVIAHFVQSYWAKNVIKQRLSDYHYSEVFTNETGMVYAYDTNVNHKNIDRYRLPLEHEVEDERLIEFIKTIEGFGTLDKTKGLAKAGLTTTGVGNFGGGSTIDLSVAGSVLGNRDVPPVCHEYGSSSMHCKARQVLNRVAEFAVAYQMNRLDERTFDRLILNESCMVNNVYGCSLVASSLWGRPAITDKERIILVSSIRYPITKTNAERLVMYANRICARLKKLDKTKDQCDFYRRDFESISNESVVYPSILNQYIVGSQPLKDKMLLVNGLRRIQNADVEISVKSHDSTPVLLVSNSSYVVMSSGFGRQHNIGSVAKLIALLDADAHYGLPIIQAMGKSSNNGLYRLASDYTSTARLEQQMMSVGLSKLVYDDLITDLSFGGVSASSEDLHALLRALYQRIERMSRANAKALSAAIDIDGGTLSHLKPMMKRYKIKTIIAKSGTHAVCNRQPSGVFGSLAVFVVEKNGRLFSIVIRMHSRNDKQPICVQSACTKLVIQNLVELAIMSL